MAILKRVRNAAKRAVAPIVSIIGAIVSILPSFLKHKKFVIWYQGRDDKWIKKSSPMSYRQCKKTIATLCADGAYLADRFKILREGVAP